jgi:uncharacterized protein
MHERRNAKTVREAYEAFQRGDIHSLLASLTPDAEWWVPGEREIMPYAGRRQGHSAIEEFFTEMARNEDVLEFTPLDFTAQDHRVVVSGHYRARVKSTGREFEYDWVHVFVFRDDKIASFREYSDTASAYLAYTQRVA